MCCGSSSRAPPSAPDGRVSMFLHETAHTLNTHLLCTLSHSQYSILTVQSQRNRKPNPATAGNSEADVGEGSCAVAALRATAVAGTLAAGATVRFLVPRSEERAAPMAAHARAGRCQRWAAQVRALCAWWWVRGGGEGGAGTLAHQDSRQGPEWYRASPRKEKKEPAVAAATPATGATAAAPATPMLPPTMAAGVKAAMRAALSMRLPVLGS